MSVSGKIDPTIDREVGIDPSILAWGASNMRMSMVELEATTDPVDYNLGYPVFLKQILGFTPLAVITAESHRGVIFTYQASNGRLRAFWPNGTEHSGASTFATGDLPIKLLVIGV